MRSRITLTDREIERAFEDRVSIKDIEFTELTIGYFSELRWTKLHTRGIMDESKSYGKFVLDFVCIFPGDRQRTLYIVDFGDVRGVALI